ncbi:hypothetical protein Pint_31802 [Pistacia integerrima]|uniref:Uncharacterized protein n=1 Tax=Pistacia integerrima TaxID=434235 RepID=A0ACC0XS48_9ROSI|nr:hypothetical protein Pint_31802 [Pistacia integerrima]
MSSFPTSSSPPTVPQHSATPFSTLHPDIIQTNIFTRLDGPTLAAAACASSELYFLSTEEKLWRNICNSTWPSINDPRISHVISTFSAGYRSFFSDSFPVLDHQQSLKHNLDFSSIITTELISCVDIYYKNSLIISKTQEIETVTGWFLCSPFRVDLFDLKESVLTPIEHGGQGDTWLNEIEENLTLSWILINPVQKQAVNLSSGRAVSVERHWLTGEIQARFATILAGDERSETEFVKCEVVVTCGGKEGGDVHVREVSLQVEDMEGRNLSGRDSLVILERAMENGRRKRGNGKEGKEKYEEFVERKRERRERKQRRERSLDMACIATGVSIFLAIWSFVLFR